MDFLLGIVCIGIFAVIIYLVPYLWTKMNSNIFSYYLKTLLKIACVIVFAYLLQNRMLTEVDKEILVCNKNDNICTYRTIIYNNQIEKEVTTFSPLDVAKIETEVASKMRRGRRGRTRVDKDYIMKLHMKAGNTLVYPITPSDYTDLEKRFILFSSYINDNNQIDYKDIKYNKIGNILKYIYIFSIFLSLLILIMDVRGWKKLASLNYHNNSIMKSKFQEFLEKGEAIITADDLEKDYELYKKWKETNPEEWKKEQEEIAKLNKLNKK